MSVSCIIYDVCVCVWFPCSGVEEPELVLSLHQSMVKQETDCGTETRIDEEKKEGGTELQADADITLDFTNAGALHLTIS